MASVDATVLIFGGSGFMGSHVIEQLSKLPIFQAKGNNVRIMTVTRTGGDWSRRWDHAERIEPLVSHKFACDREAGSLASNEELANFSMNDFGKDGVLLIADFTTYGADQMQDSLKFVRQKFGKYEKKPLYVYICSDSVYEVSKRPSNWQPSEWSVHREGDAVRPVGEDERNRLAEMDPYGEGKLAAEEILVAEHGDIPFVSFRLPDVIGPRDGSDVLDSWGGLGQRWWISQAWAHLSDKIPILIPSHLLEKPLSFVYGVDVGRIVSVLFNMLCSNSKQSLFFENKIYNFALTEKPTLPRLFDLIIEEIKMPKPKSYSPSESSGARPLAFYPSVTQGPIAVDYFLNDFKGLFELTPFDAAVKNTVIFFEDATRSIKYRKKFKDVVLKKLMEDFLENDIIKDEAEFWQCAKMKFGDF